MSLTFRGWTCACGIFNGEEKAERATCRTCDRPRPNGAERDDAWVPQLGSRVTCPELFGWEGKIVQATLTVEWSDGQRNDWHVDRLRPAPAVKKEGER